MGLSSALTHGPTPAQDAWGEGSVGEFCLCVRWAGTCVGSRDNPEQPGSFLDRVGHLELGGSIRFRPHRRNLPTAQEEEKPKTQKTQCPGWDGVREAPRAAQTQEDWLSFWPEEGAPEPQGWARVKGLALSPQLRGGPPAPWSHQQKGESWQTGWVVSGGLRLGCLNG